MTEQNQNPMDQFMPNSNEQFDPADIEANKAMGGLAYIIFFIPLIAAPQSKYARFHSNQGLLLLLLSIAASIVFAILGGILIVAGLWGLYSIISTIIWLAIGVLGIMGLINGFTGKTKELPIIGKIKIIK